MNSNEMIKDSLLKNLPVFVTPIDCFVNKRRKYKVYMKDGELIAENSKGFYINIDIKDVITAIRDNGEDDIEDVLHDQVEWSLIDEYNSLYSRGELEEEFEEDW